MEGAILIIIASLAYGLFNHFRINNERKKLKKNYNKLYTSHNNFMVRVAEVSKNSTVSEHFNQLLNYQKLDKNCVPTETETPWSDDKYITVMAKQIDKIVTNRHDIEKEWSNIENEKNQISMINLQISKEREDLEARKSNLGNRSIQIECELASDRSDIENEKRKVENKINSIDKLWGDKEKGFKVKVEEIINEGIDQASKLSDEYINLYKKDNSIKSLNTWMAEQLSELNKEVFENVAIELRTKKHPSYKGSEKVSEMGRKVKEVQKKAKVNAYTIRLYEHLFPWLEDFNDFSPSIIAQQQEKPENSNFLISDDENKFITKSESILSNSEKYQLRLDRYIRSNKSKWEIGILYERYVAYLYICDGWNIYMQGALKGFEDMGRDLIAKKDGVTKIIQCKNWSRTKTIHEKHIFQIFGTAVSYFIEEHGEKVSGNNYFSLFQEFKIIPVFYTSTKLSDQAKLCAELLGVEIIQNKKLKDFPMIKCNSNSKEDKIYHLPFDQQYDRFQVNIKKGDMYVKTVLEAENMGFRKAYFWMGAGG